MLAFALIAAASAAPDAMLIAGIGAPNLLHGRAEIFLTDTVSAELGGGVGLIPWNLTVGARWSPERTCWGCWEGHGLRLAPGVTWFVFPTDMQEGLVSVSADVAWVWRSPSGWGTSVGARLGVGPAYGQVAGGTKLELGGEIVPLQIGVMR